MTQNIVIGILAHVDAGKTTLSEAMLYESGSIRKMGRVDTMDAFLDNFQLERKRGITIFSKQAQMEWDGQPITLLDTPGHVDFSADMERTLQVLDYAILLISAKDGVQSHTRTLWRLLERYHVPTFLFVNKMDQPGTEQNDVLTELQKELSTDCVEYGRDAFFEQVATCHERLLDEYLENGTIAMEHIKREVRHRNVFPVFFGAALRQDGVSELMRGMGECMCTKEYPDEFGAKVYKITRDAQGNRLTHMKITGGALHVKDSIPEKINQIRIYSGEKYQTKEVVEAGEICAVTGLSETAPGQGLGADETHMDPSLEPVVTYRVILPEGLSPLVFLPKLMELQEELPELHIVWKEQIQEIQVQIMGQVQLEILQSLIEERYGIDVTFDIGDIIYKETIANTVEGVGHFEPLRHYAEVHLKMEPLVAGSGMEFGTECSEDLLERNWQRLILTHLQEREHVGVLTGSHITDMKITLISGRAHTKHTEGGDFRQATYRAVRQGLMEAENILLEPYYEFELKVPEANVGRAMMDIEQKCGTCQLADMDGEMRIIRGSTPVATMGDYASLVRAYTGGQGSMTYQIKGYGPCHNSAEVIAKIGYEVEHDVVNPTGSVFCAHGSGYQVPWDEVKEHMHLPCQGQKRAPGEEAMPALRTSAIDDWIPVDEIERILAGTRRTGEAKRKGYQKAKGAVRVTAASHKPAKPQPIREKYLLVDGYNVIFAWDELNELSKTTLDGARGKLMDILCNYQAIKDVNLILVFDAYRVAGHKTEITDYHNIHVVYTKEAETADQYIEKFAHENGVKYDITVATSDGLEQIIIRGQGCHLLSARELERDVVASMEEIRKTYNQL